MDKRYRLAVIGVGRPWKSEGSTGFGMAHAHVQGFRKTDRCDLVAIADVRRDNAEAFAAQYGGPRIYAHYKQMLKDERPDIVSICTWPHLHAPMTLAAAEAGVRAIHCEKPMALRWGEARAMHETCTELGVQLTFNHQRRFLEPFQKVRDMIRDRAIGALLRLEAQCADLFDWGTHWIDMLHFFNDETPAEWVIAQIDCRVEHKVFGVPLENQGLCHFKFTNGVRATLVTGHEADIGCAIRVIGDEGTIEIGWDRPVVRSWLKGQTAWTEVPVSEGIHDNVAHERVAADIVRCLDTGERPLLSSYNAVRSTEVIFAAYESSRSRGRIDLPLQTDDSALLSMLVEGLIGPRGKSKP
jgi:predicted dehydrogenase